MFQKTGQNIIQTYPPHSNQPGHTAENSVQISQYKILNFPFREQRHIVSMALTSANFHNASLSSFPLSSLTINKDWFQIVCEEMEEEIGTCGLMPEDISVALIRQKIKTTKFDESFIVDSGRWFPWQLTWEVIELEELRAPLLLHPQLIKRLSGKQCW